MGVVMWHQIAALNVSRLCSAGIILTLLLAIGFMLRVLVAFSMDGIQRAIKCPPSGIEAGSRETKLDRMAWTSNSNEKQTREHCADACLVVQGDKTCKTSCG